MIDSGYIKNILLLLAEGHEEENNLLKQIGLLTDAEYTYTGAGLFVGFACDEGIEAYRVMNSDDTILSGVLVESPELQLGANAQLFFDKGIILYLELFARDAEYPKKPLDRYELSQEWLPGGGRKIRFP